MKRFLGAAGAMALLAVLASVARADEKEAKAILAKGIKALGGEEKLAKAKAFTYKTKGTITLNESDSEFTSQATAQGLNRYRSEFQGEFGGNKVKGVTVIDGDKGWQKFGEMGGEIPKERLANEKRNVAIILIPITLLPLKGKGFKIDTAGEEKVDGKAALGLKVTGPDGKDFKLFFDKDAGLPVKVVAKVRGFMGQEVTQETTLGGYKDFAGIKKATKIETKRDGEKFMKTEITEFKVLDKVDPKTFAEPE
jgi:hypothetical protein